MYVYAYVYLYLYVMHMYMYIERERRDKERDDFIYVCAYMFVRAYYILCPILHHTHYTTQHD